MFTGGIDNSFLNSKPVTWVVTVDNRQINTDGVTSVNATWDSRLADGTVVKGGTSYPAKLTISNSCGCGDTRDLTVVVSESPPNNTCGAGSPTVTIGSAANVASGNLSHSQELFSFTGGVLPLSITLYYNSLNTTSTPFGPGWSHNYSMSVATNSDGSVTLTDLNWLRKTYPLVNGAFVSPTGDHSALVKNADNSFTVTYPEGKKYRFGTDGKLTSISDRHNNTITLGYDTEGRLATITDAAGRVARLNYVNGLVDTITDPRSKPYTFSYTAGFLTGIQYPADGAWSYGYTGGYLSFKTDPMGNTTSYSYVNDRINTATDPSQKTRSVVPPAGSPSGVEVINNLWVNIYDQQQLESGEVSTARSVTFTEKDGGVWTYTYDTANNLLKSKTDPYGKITSYAYYPDKTIKAKTEPGLNGKTFTTFYTYDAHGNVATVTEPADLSVHTPIVNPETVTDPATLAGLTPPIKTAFVYDYDPANNDRIESIIDNRGATPLITTFGYGSEIYDVDKQGEVVKITEPGNVGTIIKYYANGSIREVIDANNTTITDGVVTEKPGAKKTTYTYRPDGLLETVTEPTGVITLYSEYDQSGNNTEMRIKDTDGIVRKTIKKVYDDRNRLKTGTLVVPGKPDIVTTYDYDGNGNLASVIDAEGREAAYEYDYNRQVTRITDAKLNETILRYGATGCSTCGGGVDKLTALYDAKVTKLVPLEDQPHTAYSYDKVGRLENETDPVGKRYHYTYHDNGKVKEKYDATNGLPGTLLISYEYNNRGHLTAKHHADGSPDVTYRYDANGRLEYAANGAVSYTYQYHPDGRFKSVIDSNGRIVSVDQDQYDALGRRKQVKIQDGSDQRIINYTYDDKNRPETIQSSAGTFTYDYDKLSRRWHTMYPNGITATYGYDDLDGLTSITHAYGGTAIASVAYIEFDKVGNRKAKTSNGSIVEQYGYDEIYRLILTPFLPNNPDNYDEVGNRKLGPGAKDNSYAHDAANRMTQGRKLSYGYDNAGNQILKIVPAAEDKTWTQTWDLENRLVKVEKVKGAERRTVTFSYDPFGRRIGKQVAIVKSGVTKTSSWSYVYDNDDIALEIYTDETGAVTKTFYTHGAGIDEHLALERSGQYFYYHVDGLGNIVSITDASRNVVQNYEYDSFGMAKPSTAFTNSYTYTGREWDKEAGLYYYRARYYDPMEGRFISKDPIGFAGEDINLYNYVQNNSINLIDPTGLDWFRPKADPYVVGRRGSRLVAPGKGIGKIIDDYVPAGHTFGTLHDDLVDMGREAGLPDALINIPTMLGMYVLAVGTELDNSLYKQFRKKPLFVCH